MGKLLTILGISEETQKGLPADVFTAEKVIDGLQGVYAKAPESPKKDRLAIAISESVRLLMAKIQPYIIEEKKEEETKKEEEKLPDEARAPKVKRQQPDAPQPPEIPEAPKPKQAPPKPEKPEEEPPKAPHKVEEEPMTCDEIKDAIKGLSLLVKMGDDEAKEIVKSLKLKLKTQNC
jgi:outer membrane biosynthesis protein TonB